MFSFLIEHMLFRYGGEIYDFPHTTMIASRDIHSFPLKLNTKQFTFFLTILIQNNQNYIPGNRVHSYETYNFLQESLIVVRC